MLYGCCLCKSAFHHSYNKLLMMAKKLQCSRSGLAWHPNSRELHVRGWLPATCMILERGVAPRRGVYDDDRKPKQILEVTKITRAP